MTTEYDDLRALYRELGQRLDDAQIAVAAPWPAMGHLLEAMRARGWGVEIRMWTGDERPFEAQFHGGPYVERGPVAPTLPEAVARAALAALEAE